MIDWAKYLLLLIVVMLLTACGPSGNDTTEQKNADTEIAKNSQQRISSAVPPPPAPAAPSITTQPDIATGIKQISAQFANSALDLSKVSVARMTLAGKPFEVTSLQPYARPKKWKAEGLSVTAFYFNKAKDALNLITVDTQAGTTITTTLHSDWLKGGGEITFPIADKMGNVKPTLLKSLELLTR